MNNIEQRANQFVKEQQITEESARTAFIAEAEWMQQENDAATTILLSAMIVAAFELKFLQLNMLIKRLKKIKGTMPAKKEVRSCRGVRNVT